MHAEHLAACLARHVAARTGQLDAEGAPPGRHGVRDHLLAQETGVVDGHRLGELLWATRNAGCWDVRCSPSPHSQGYAVLTNIPAQESAQAGSSRSGGEGAVGIGGTTLLTGGLAAAAGTTANAPAVTATAAATTTYTTTAVVPATAVATTAATTATMAVVCSDCTAAVAAGATASRTITNLSKEVTVNLPLT